MTSREYAEQAPVCQPMRCANMPAPKAQQTVTAKRRAQATAPFPSLYRYAIAHPCPTCKAPAGTHCKAPRKQGAAAARNGVRAELGLAALDTRSEEIHAARHDVGRRHYRRDVGNAPWADEREPGQRYDTLGGEAA